MVGLLCGLLCDLALGLSMFLSLPFAHSLPIGERLAISVHFCESFAFVLLSCAALTRSSFLSLSLEGRLLVKQALRISPRGQVLAGLLLPGNPVPLLVRSGIFQDTFALRLSTTLHSLLPSYALTLSLRSTLAVLALALEFFLRDAATLNRLFGCVFAFRLFSGRTSAGCHFSRLAIVAFTTLPRPQFAFRLLLLLGHELALGQISGTAVKFFSSDLCRSAIAPSLILGDANELDLLWSGRALPLSLLLLESILRGLGHALCLPRSLVRVRKVPPLVTLRPLLSRHVITLHVYPGVLGSA